jgi:4-carboxymuconolactone decarboxylase
MPRMPYPDPACLSKDIREKISRLPSNVSSMLAGASPGVNRGFAAFAAALIDDSPLPAQLREIAILRVGYLSNAPYEIYQHEALARHVGLSGEAIEAIQVGGEKAEVLGEAGCAVLTFTDDLVRNVRPGDASLAEIRAHLDDSMVIDLTLAIGAYMMICRFLETTGIEIDGAPIDWGARADTNRKK